MSADHPTFSASGPDATYAPATFDNVDGTYTKGVTPAVLLAGQIGVGIGVREGIGTYNGLIPSAEPTATASGGDAPYYQRPRSKEPGQMSRLRDDEIEVAGSGGRVGDAMR